LEKTCQDETKLYNFSKEQLKKRKKYFRKKEESHEKERKKTIGPDGVP